MAVKIQYQPVAAKSFDRRELTKDFEETRHFPKVKQTRQQQNELKNAGFTPVLSSWVSAAGEQNGDLYVRFHNKNVYKYVGLGNLLPDLVRAVSPGRFMWKRVFRKPGQKVGALPLKATGEEVIDVSGGGLDTVEFIDAKEETLGFGQRVQVVPKQHTPITNTPDVLDVIDITATIMSSLIWTNAIFNMLILNGPETSTES